MIGTIWQGVAYFGLFLAILLTCLMIAAFRVWRDELRDKERIVANIGNGESYRRQMLSIGMLINQGRELLQINLIHSGNATQILAEVSSWREEVRKFIQTNVPGVEIKSRDLSAFMLAGISMGRGEIENDIELLKTVQSGLPNPNALIRNSPP
jgi:hypothetical protein